MKVLVIDSDAVFQMIKHTELSHLTYESLEIGIVFGFVRQIQVIGSIYMPNVIAFCWDSRENIRKKMSSVYKANRKKDDIDPKVSEAIYKQKAILEAKLPALGFSNHFKLDGYESDDLIASLTINNPDDEWIIATHDNDLYQLLTDKVSIYNIKKKGPYTATTFMKEYGIKPNQWPQVKALGGCNSDNVIGIEGVAETTAIKHILGRLSPTSKAYARIMSPISQALIDSNYLLVKLPLAGTPEYHVQKDEVDFKEVVAFFEKFSFRSFLEDRTLGKWRDLISCLNR